MFELKIVTHFAAAHNLKMVAQKCENLHGHNWKVETSVIGSQLNAAGVLIDFGELKGYVKQIMNDLDHKYLNELDYFTGGNPSSENIAVYIANRLQDLIHEKGATVSKVTVWESENACATYMVPPTT
ncbi:MAG: 6-carboxytetrahydropterin synthase QueD [Proteobacteria bacterium]|nr:6-carboxytetrahydropterin synthase QueD [Pseudomonadota bacterium]